MRIVKNRTNGTKKDTEKKYKIISGDDQVTVYSETIKRQ